MTQVSGREDSDLQRSGDRSGQKESEIHNMTAKLPRRILGTDVNQRFTLLTRGVGVCAPAGGDFYFPKHKHRLGSPRGETRSHYVVDNADSRTNDRSTTENGTISKSDISERKMRRGTFCGGKTQGVQYLGYTLALPIRRGEE